MRGLTLNFLKESARAVALMFTVAVSVLLTSMIANASPVNVDSNGVAIQGYDPVSYFVNGKPMKGSQEFSAEFGGATYYFSSMEHQAVFKANPEKYIPQYGGYCAYGLAYGSKAPVEVDKFSIVDGKLYLNFNGDIQSRWSKDVPGFIAKANKNWQNIE